MIDNCYRRYKLLLALDGLMATWIEKVRYS